MDSLFSPGATNYSFAMSEVGGWLRGVSKRLSGTKWLVWSRRDLIAELGHLSDEMARMSAEILAKRDELTKGEK